MAKPSNQSKSIKINPTINQMKTKTKNTTQAWWVKEQPEKEMKKMSTMTKEVFAFCFFNWVCCCCCCCCVIGASIVFLSLLIFLKCHCLHCHHGTPSMFSSLNCIAFDIIVMMLPVVIIDLIQLTHLCCVLIASAFCHCHHSHCCCSLTMTFFVVITCFCHTPPFCIVIGVIDCHHCHHLFFFSWCF